MADMQFVPLSSFSEPVYELNIVMGHVILNSLTSRLQAAYSLGTVEVNTETPSDLFHCKL